MGSQGPTRSTPIAEWVDKSPPGAVYPWFKICQCIKCGGTLPRMGDTPCVNQRCPFCNSLMTQKV